MSFRLLSILTKFQQLENAALFQPLATSLVQKFRVPLKGSIQQKIISIYLLVDASHNFHCYNVELHM